MSTLLVLSLDIIAHIMIWCNIILAQLRCSFKLFFDSWIFKLSEWAHFSKYDVGLNSGSSASHILVSYFSLNLNLLFDDNGDN